MEQGYYQLNPGEAYNDVCRRVNNQGWDVLQVDTYWDGTKRAVVRGVLLQKMVDTGLVPE